MTGDTPVQDIAATDRLKSLTQQLKDAVETIQNDPAPLDDGGDRASLVEAAEALLNTTRQPIDRIMGTIAMVAQFTAIRLFIKWKAFESIPAEGAISYAALAATLGADTALITRMAWILVANGLLTQVDANHVAHTQTSIIFASTNPLSALVQMGFDDYLSTLAAMPEYFDQFGLKEPNGLYNTIYAYSCGDTKLTVEEHMGRNPERMANFMLSMAAVGHNLTMTGSYDFSWILQEASRSEDRVLLVDIGGGKGRAVNAICQATPGLPYNRCVVEDRPSVSEDTRASAEGEMRQVQYVGMDYHKEQPIKGGLVYYIRRCVHDYGDEDAVKMLQQIHEAMAADSRLLIVEQILDNPPSPMEAATDLFLVGIGGKERTVDGFRCIISRAGLCIKEIHHANKSDVAVIECMKL